MALDTLTRIETDAGVQRGRMARWLPVSVVLTAVAVLAVGPTALLAGPVAVAAVSADLVRIDVEFHRLPNRLVLPCFAAALAGIALHGILDGSTPIVALGAGAAWFGFFLLLNLGGGMGMGDVKLAGVLGLCLGSVGIAPAVLGIVFSFLLGGAAAVVVLARRVGGGQTRIPFGPFLLTGFWIALALSPALAGPTP